MSDKPEGDPAWERRIVEKLALETLAEQKRRRRWGIFFKFLGFVYLTFLIAVLGDWGSTAEKLADGKKYTALVQLNGVIKSTGEASAEKIVEALQAAFKDQGTRGVVLRINSPGGSPVQSGIINDEIRRLRAKHPEIPLYAVVEDVCASGGYYVAAAADKIYVDKASIVGSIGVLMDGFGFTGAMDKLGIERRLLTAGANKGFLDPFSPQDETSRLHAQQLLDVIHRQFITAVRDGRGDRLRDQPEIFTGLVWTGTRAIELGLVDDLGSVRTVARDALEVEALVDYTPRESVAERLARQVGAYFATGFGTALDAGIEAGTATRLR